MTQENESQINKTKQNPWQPLLFDQPVLVFMHPAEAECVTIQDSPQWLTVAWACENRGKTQPSFWCSAWVGNLNTKMHSIDSWPCERVFNSLLFCFGLVSFSLPFLRPLLNKDFWLRGNGPDWWSSFLMRFDFWQAREASADFHEHFLSFKFSVFLICQRLIVVVWTLTQNTDHDFKGWTINLLRNSAG